MIFGKSLTTQDSLPGLIMIWVCVCAFSLSAFPQVAVLSWVEMAEEEAPAQEDEENCEKELEVFSSTRRRFKRRFDVVLYQSSETINRPKQTSRPAQDRLMIVGHQYAHGLCAPLLV